MCVVGNAEGMTTLGDETIRRLKERASGPAPRDEIWGTAALPGPLTGVELDAVEATLGFTLPVPVRQIYGTVANGGFGPGYGLFGLLGGYPSDLGRDAISEYSTFRLGDPEDPGWAWPEGLLPVMTWGCAIYSCVDCTQPHAPVLRFDPNEVDSDWATAFSRESESLDRWLGDWLAGEDLFSQSEVNR